MSATPHIVPPVPLFDAAVGPEDLGASLRTLDAVGDGAFVVDLGISPARLVHVTPRLLDWLDLQSATSVELVDRLLTTARLAEITDALRLRGELRANWTFQGGGDVCRNAAIIAREIPGSMPGAPRVVVTLVAREPAAEAGARVDVARERDLFRTLTENVSELIFVLDVAGRIRYASPALKRVLGHDPERVLDQPARDLIHPAHRAALDERFALLAAHPERSGQHPFEVRLQHVDGSWRWFEAVATNSLDDPAVTGIIVHSRDVTERKTTELALQQTRMQLDVALQGAELGVWTTDLRTGFGFVDGNCLRLLGRENERNHQGGRHAHTSWWHSRTHPDDMLRAQMAMEEHLAGRAEWYESEYRVLHANGEWRWIFSRGRVSARMADGQPARMEGVMLDIDRRKRTELALGDTETRFETALWTSRLAFWGWDLETDHGEESDHWFQITGYARDKWRAEESPWSQRVHPDDLPRVLASRDAHVAGESERYEAEYRFRIANGQWKWLLDRGRITQRDEQGRALHMLGTSVDIDAIKGTEQRLRDSEYRYRTIASLVPGYVQEGEIRADGHFAATWASRGVELVLGCSADDYLRRGWLAYVADDDRDRIVALEAQIRRGENAESEVRVVDVAGRTRWLHVRNRTLADRETNLVTRVFSVCIDITERKELEREIIEISNRERQQIGNDLHDGLGQELAGIAMLLRSLSRDMQDRLPGATPTLDEAVALVNQATESARMLARGLSPLGFGREGLATALRQLIERASDIYDVDLRFSVRGDSDQNIDDTAANHLYRIAQESLTNAIRHSGARRITVRLHTLKRRGTLTVTDDGRGLCAGSRVSNGMGLRIMAYRATMIGGNVRIADRRPRGVRVHCSFPLAGATQRITRER